MRQAGKISSCPFRTFPFYVQDINYRTINKTKKNAFTRDRKAHQNVQPGPSSAPPWEKQKRFQVKKQKEKDSVAKGAPSFANEPMDELLIGADRWVL